MLTFIATDLQLYKIFNIKQVSFFGTQCNEFTFIVDDGLLMASTSISGYGACETLIPVTVLYNDLATGPPREGGSRGKCPGARGSQGGPEGPLNKKFKLV